MSQGAPRVIDVLRGQGATFLHRWQAITKVRPRRGRDGVLCDEPGALLEGIGSLMLDVQHRLLVPGLETISAVHGGVVAADAEALGSFAFFADTQGVKVGQWVDYPDGRSPDGNATGLLALATLLYPHLRPIQGWVDECGWNMPEGKTVTSPNPRFLFWANFFGPERVETMGREFLKGTPGWVSVDLDDGGILHVATESYQDWWDHDQPELLAYFRQRFPKIKIYRAEPIPG
jgi:hypothetical protein